jgi:alpha-D-xyloside xylohydrolase
MSSFTEFVIAAAAVAGLSSAALGQAGGAENIPNGVIVPAAGGFVKVDLVAEGIVHVAYAPDRAFFTRTSFAVLPAVAPRIETAVGGSGTAVQLVSPRLTVTVDSRSGAVSVARAGAAAGGPPLLAETARTLTPAEIQGEKTFHVRQQWATTPDEAFFGLGQHQYGLTNIKGYDIDLWQHNTEVAVPLLLSSKGYGIFWNNDSFTKFGDPRDYTPIPAERLTAADGTAGGFTRTSFSDQAMTAQTGRRVDPAIAQAGGGGGGGRGRGGNQEAAVRWEGTVTADAGGDYKFNLYANGGAKLWIDDRPVADHWRQNWLPWSDLAVARFEAGSTHKIRVDWVKDGGAYCSLTWKGVPGPRPADAPPGGASAGDTSLWSQVGDGIDYYVIDGGGEADKATGQTPLDRVIAGYRTLTGKAPMMPQWAFGLWQSRQRYETQQASLDVVKGFRDRKIPFDTIVQDWMYWRQNDWGSHAFDPQRFPDPEGWIKEIHAQNARLMISVWGKFYPTTDNYKALDALGAMYPVYPVRDWVSPGFSYAFYDAFNPAGRDLFWRQVNDGLFSKGVDAWWMDATEPDVVQPSPPTLEKMQANMAKTAAGIGPRVMNAYPLLNSQAVYEGQRKAAPNQRVFILTRSGYAGQQRYAAATWSGDITSTWTAMKKQIAAGLGYSISGLPYWTMDAGGFSVPGKFSGRNASPAAVDEWRELNTRWLQFAAFLPLMRVHGEAPFREMWQFGGETSDAYKAQLKIDRLHYQLFPYLYSLAGDVTHHDGTFLRPLVMDAPDDATARDVADQFLLGRGLMVSPVTAYQARARDVYLPATPGGWYDFWAGTAATPRAAPGPLGGLTVKEVSAPYDQIPVHVRAGTILPIGPDVQYIGEKKADPLTLYVYTGADGRFALYEDDGLTYAYEQGAFAKIPVTWNDATRTLTVERREGQFPGMLQSRTFNVVFVGPEKAVPFDVNAPASGKTVTYTGERVEVKL